MNRASTGILLLAVVASGCSTAVGSANQNATEMMGGNGVGSAIGSQGLRGAYRTSIQVPIDEAWRNVQGAYAALGIPLTEKQDAGYLIGNEGMNPTNHRLAGQMLSGVLECGNGSGGPNADMYKVHMSVVTQLTANKDGSTGVATLVQAEATPVAFAAGPVECGTTGWLERKIETLSTLPSGH